MKKLSIILIITVTALFFIALGWWFGRQQSLRTEDSPVPTLDNSISETMKHFSMFRQLDSGKIEDAKHMLKLRLDGDILIVESLLGDRDDNGLIAREKVWKILAMIADYREAHPYSYTGSIAKVDQEVDGKIALILRRAKQKNAVLGK